MIIVIIIIFIVIVSSSSSSSSISRVRRFRLAVADDEPMRFRLSAKRR